MFRFLGQSPAFLHTMRSLIQKYEAGQIACNEKEASLLRSGKCLKDKATAGSDVVFSSQREFSLDRLKCFLGLPEGEAIATMKKLMVPGGVYHLDQANKVLHESIQGVPCFQTTSS